MTSLSKPPPPNPKVDRVSKRIAEYIGYMKPLFIPGSIFTVIVRQPGDDAGNFDFMMGDDDPAELAKFIERAKGREAF